MDYSRELAMQLAFGAPFNPTANDERAAQMLVDGILELPPHRPWRMPATLTWRENPYKEPNWVAQFHMLRWLDPLRREAQKGKPELIDTWLSVAESWIEANPPGRGRANYSWADMVEAARALTLCFGLPAVEDLRPERLPGLLTSIADHGRWLEDASHIRTGNHALQQHQGLLVIGAVLQRHDWVELAVDRARALLISAYDEQGVNEEGTPQYHQINYTWWRTLSRRVCIVTGAVPPEFARIDRAPEAMAHATRPDGYYELIGDTEEFRPRGLGHPAIDYVSSAGREGTPPSDRVAVYDAGYAFGRSDWGREGGDSFQETSFYSLRFGRQDRIHGHVDGMALTVFAGGSSLLVDSGKYAYDAKDPYRAHLLSREAHNSLSVKDKVYDQSSVVELVTFMRGEDFEWFRFRDTGYPDVELSRDVLICAQEGIAVVLDGLKADEEVTASQWWHFHPSMGHRREGSSVFAPDGRSSVRLSWVDEAAVSRVVKGTKYPMQGWFSPRWRVLEPTRTVEAVMRGRVAVLPTAISFQDALRSLTIEACEGNNRHFRIRRGEDEVWIAEFDADVARLSRV
jgi:hypothetical protein